MLTAAGAALPPLAEVIRRHGIAARRALGQHFLLDGHLTDRIVRTAGDLEGVNVIEVGAGPGGLTRSLLASSAACVIAIEKDPRCLAALEELAAWQPQRLRIIAADALAVDCRTLAPPPRRVIANLPYNIATPLLIGWLKQILDYAGFTLMFQKEVAARLAAQPGSPAYGRLSVLVQWLACVGIEFTVDPRAFSPPPKVTSAVVTVTPRPQPLAPADLDALQTITRAAFGQRRKMLRSSLRSLGLDPGTAGIPPEQRADALSVEQFCALARAWRASQTAVAAVSGPA
jgi:16S rRNA (adenine1518-N6/adenine1519-N6)-dimethyltransferase